ncbi:hypothetical protein UFOVP184_28 [uncultured Caudovirales phage]|uniref:Uncharacterized protein n=1 Tax=uncultured Caudovirales phage TaxID=2100421 RepID=A0A6J7WDH9_9CAUD|nr:hypothetical protein UFOVP184_28 [uncultured Caudovirales phage]
MALTEQQQIKADDLRFTKGMEAVIDTALETGESPKVEVWEAIKGYSYVAFFQFPVSDQTIEVMISTDEHRALIYHTLNKAGWECRIVLD